MLQVNNRPSLDYYLEDPELLQRHEMAKPPLEAYLYMPNEIEIIELNQKNPTKTLRRIFEMKYADYSKFEIEKIAELEHEIQLYNQKEKNEKLIFPENYKLSEKYRYHQATGFKNSKTIELLRENIKWRTTKIPPPISSKTIELLNCGFMYIHGRDVNFRPIMVLNAIHYMKLKDKYSFDDWVNCVIYFMEYTVNNLLVPGQVENWDIITDLAGVSLVWLPSDLKKVMGILQSNYRCRLYVNYIFGMSSILKGIWGFVSTFLDEMTVRKIRFLNNDNKKELFTYISEDQVEKRFGGKAPDVIPGGNNCFPPISPDNSNLYIHNRTGGKLLSEEEYKELHLNGKLAVTAPYFLKKWKDEDEKKALILEQEEFEMKKKHIEEMEVKSKINEEIIVNPRSILEIKCNFNSLRQNSLANINDEVHKIHQEFTPSGKLRMKNMKKKLNHSGFKDAFEKEEGFNLSPDTLMLYKGQKQSKSDSKQCSIVNYTNKVDNIQLARSKPKEKDLKEKESSEKESSLNENMDINTDSETVFEKTKTTNQCTGCSIY